MRWSPTAAAPTISTRPRPAVADDVRRAYLEQLDALQALDARVILMASRALARVARSPADYAAYLCAMCWPPATIR